MYLPNFDFLFTLHGIQWCYGFFSFNEINSGNPLTFNQLIWHVSFRICTWIPKKHIKSFTKDHTSIHVIAFKKKNPKIVDKVDFKLGFKPKLKKNCIYSICFYFVLICNCWKAKKTYFILLKKHKISFKFFNIILPSINVQFNR